MILTLATAPVIEPVSLNDAKQHCRIDLDDDDPYVASLITAARSHVEHVTNRALVTQTWDYWMDAFPGVDTWPIYIPKPPLQSVTYVKYMDTDDVEQTWAASNYTVDTDSYEGRIYPVYEGEYPSDVQLHQKAVNIRFVCGYADSGASPQDIADNVPIQLKQAIMLMVSHLYENRETTLVGTNITTVPQAFDALVASYRVFRH